MTMIRIDHLHRFLKICPLAFTKIQAKLINKQIEKVLHVLEQITLAKKKECKTIFGFFAQITIVVVNFVLHMNPNSFSDLSSETDYC